MLVPRALHEADPARREALLEAAAALVFADFESADESVDDPTADLVGRLEVLDQLRRHYRRMEQRRAA